MNAIGITSHAGRYGGTYAHSDIAFEFASWISPELGSFNRIVSFHYFRTHFIACLQSDQCKISKVPTAARDNHLHSLFSLIGVRKQG
ncbi:MAG: KilA-N domain-containing protein [Lachnospiraceae bacterium]|nr:KilA-N domain-containing protein [Lachnospiraceae bacterium]MBQ5675225.1 KilA-N domain-containing protein [Lachnospiraceae bacterium]